MTTYEKEILTVIQDGFRIGYMTRRHNVYGFSSEVEMGWCVSMNIKEPTWHGNYKTRKEARQYIEWMRMYLQQIAATRKKVDTYETQNQNP